MVILMEYQTCYDLPSFPSVCETGGQVTVSIQDVIQEPQCNFVTVPEPYIAITAPNTSLPINWQISVTTE